MSATVGASTAAPQIPAGHEDDVFRHMLDMSALYLWGKRTADREYAEMICEQLDDDELVPAVVDDVVVGTGLDVESAWFVVWAAVVCFRPEHADLVLPPDPSSTGAGA